MNVPSFTIKRFENLPNDVAEQADKLHGAAFNFAERMSPEQYAEHKDQFYSKKYAVFIAFDGETVVGKVAVLKREITFDNEPVIIGGIAGVVTAPEYQKKGIATDLLQAAYKDLQDHGCDVMFLCTDLKKDHLVKLYRKFGFEILKQPYLVHGKSGKIYQNHNGMLGPVNSCELFEKIMWSQTPLDIGDGNW